MTSNRRRRGHIAELPSGSFRVAVYAGVDPLTKKERYLRETHARYRDAEKALTRLQNQVDEQRHPKSAITVRQAVEQWLEVEDHATSTRERYSDLIRIYINPVFGDEQAGRLSAEVLERFYARLQGCRDVMCTGRRKRNGHICAPLAANTVRKIHFILSGAYERAHRWGYVTVNVAEMAEPPAFEPGEPDPPSPAEAALLISDAWATDPEWGLLLWLTMLTGSRRGELCGLRWRHVDFERGILTIERSGTRTKAGVEDKKTKTSRTRRVALDPETLQLLSEHQERRRADCEALDAKLSPDAFVFSLAPNSAEPMKPPTVSQRYRRSAERLGMRSTRLHSLRHYNATELIAAGVDIRTVAGRLGHGGGGATTLRTYAAFVGEADRRAATTMAGLMPARDASREPRSPYEVLAAAICADIAAGRLNAGDQLPPIAELAKAHGLSAGTGHRAVTHLRERGVVRLGPGRRSIVA